MLHFKNYNYRQIQITIHNPLKVEVLKTKMNKKFKKGKERIIT